MHLVQKVQIETPSPQTDAEYNNRTVNSCGEHGMEEGPVHQWAAFTVHQGLGLKEARDSRQCAWFQLLLSCAFRVRAFCYCLILKIAQIFPGCAVVYIEENGYHFIIIIAAIICAYYTHDEDGGSLRESSWWWSRRCWLFCSPVTKMMDRPSGVKKAGGRSSRAWALFGKEFFDAKKGISWVCASTTWSSQHRPWHCWWVGWSSSVVLCEDRIALLTGNYKEGY